MNLSFNGHVVDKLCGNNSISVVVPITGSFCGKPLNVRTSELSEYSELTRKEKAIELRKAK